MRLLSVSFFTFVSLLSWPAHVASNHIQTEQQQSAATDNTTATNFQQLTTLSVGAYCAQLSGINACSCDKQRCCGDVTVFSDENGSDSEDENYDNADESFATPNAARDLLKQQRSYTMSYYDATDYYRQCLNATQCHQRWFKWISHRPGRRQCDCDSNCCGVDEVPHKPCPERNCPYIEQFYVDPCACSRYCCAAPPHPNYILHVVAGDESTSTTTMNQGRSLCELKLCQSLRAQNLDGCLCERECCDDPDVPPPKPERPSIEYVRSWYHCRTLRQAFITASGLDFDKMPSVRNGTVPPC